MDVMTADCRRCNRTRPIQSRGLCKSCYITAHRNGTVGDYDLVGQPNQTTHTRTCPECSDGGLVTTYIAINGTPVSYICLARAHGLKGFRFELVNA